MLMRIRYAYPFLCFCFFCLWFVCLFVCFFFLVFCCFVKTQTCQSLNVSRSWQCMSCTLPKIIISTQNGTEKSCTTQWLSYSLNGMISLKIYVKTPAFNILITLSLGIGHIQANRSSGPKVVFSEVDS